MKNHIRNRLCSKGIFLSVWGVAGTVFLSGILPPGPCPDPWAAEQSLWEIAAMSSTDPWARLPGQGGSRGAVPHETELLGVAPGMQPSCRGVPGAVASAQEQEQEPGQPEQVNPHWGARSPPRRCPLSAFAASRIPLLLTPFPIWHLGCRGNSKLPFPDQISSQLVSTPQHLRWYGNPRQRSVRPMLRTETDGWTAPGTPGSTGTMAGPAEGH